MFVSKRCMYRRCLLTARICTVPDGKWDFSPCSSSLQTKCHLAMLMIPFTIHCFKNMSDVQNTESLKMLYFV